MLLLKDLFEEDRRFKVLERRNSEEISLKFVDDLRRKQRQTIVEKFRNRLKSDSSIDYRSRFKEIMDRIDDRKAPFDVEEFRNEVFIS